MFITDAHCDTLYENLIAGTPAGNCVVTPERLRAGGVGLQTFAIFSSLRQKDPYADALTMLEGYKVLPYNHLDARLPEKLPEGVNCILSAEGGEMFKGDIAKLRAMDDAAHIRLIAITWNYENELAMPAALDETTGLKPRGFEFLREMDARGIAADVSHLNIAGFYDVVEHAAVPPLASHSDCRALCNVPRDLWDEQIRALIDRKGFIGVNFYSEFLASGREATLEDVAIHIEHICELGGEDTVGFGSDFDGIDVWPEGLAHPGDFPNVLDALRRRGFTEDKLEKIAGGNYYAYLRRCEAAAARV